MSNVNAIHCLDCGDTPESKHRHDFRWCRCGKVFVDGGRDYQKVGYHEGARFEVIKTRDELEALRGTE